MVTLPARGTMVAENVTITGCRKDDTGNVKVVFFSMKGWKGEFNLLRSGDINLVRDRWTDLFTVRGKVLVTNDTYVTLKVEELSPVSGEL